MGWVATLLSSHTNRLRELWENRLCLVYLLRCCLSPLQDLPGSFLPAPFHSVLVSHALLVPHRYTGRLRVRQRCERVRRYHTASGNLGPLCSRQTLHEQRDRLHFQHHF